jgi:MtfA peptidase
MKLSSARQLKYFFIGNLLFLFTGIIFDMPALSIACAMILFVTVYVAATQSKAEESEKDNAFEEIQKKNALVYHGAQLNFSEPELHRILDKYLPFFNSLNGIEKGLFVSRLKHFIASKSFIVHDASGYKEMPVLVAAAAIQLSFGLNKYLLPSFPVINIYPMEFLRTEPSITFLIGNVSNHAINISWKHFLEGFHFPDDGQNVGLHEMSHAYYYQNFATQYDIDDVFTANYSPFDVCCNKIFLTEKMEGNDLYTDYGLTNLQEFWAESTEIFFEKPFQMQQTHPDLYAAMCKVLNQNPVLRCTAFQ